MIFQNLTFGVLLLAMVAAVVCAFYVPYRRNRSRMTKLWLVAWLITISRSMLPHLKSIHIHLPDLVLHTMADIILAIASIVFLWSFASSPSDYKRLHVPWAELLMVEISGYCVIAHLWQDPRPLHAVLLLISAAVVTLTFVRWLRTSAALPKMIYLPLITGTTLFSVFLIIRGNYLVPIYLLQSSCNLCTAIFLLRRYRTISGAAILTASSFIVWAGMPYVRLVSVGPSHLAAFARGYMETVGLITLLAALGMLSLLLEEEIQINVLGRERERRVRQELEAYAQLDLHIMPGADPHQAAERVCRLAVEHSIFQQAVIFLRDVKQTFYVAAAEGMSPELLRALEALGQRMTDARLSDFQRDLSRQRVSPHSSRVNLRALFLPGDPLEELNFVSAISINLRAQTGVVIGSLLLGDPKEQLQERKEDLRADDLLPLETLVAKLAIAIENTMLTQRLLRSEKLAGLGQLAGGVAHELNNPLTVVMGYSELMTDAHDTQEMREQAGIIHKEALRMKEIVESLVRFWRPAPNNSQQINLTQTLRDIYRLRNAELERRGIHFEMNVPPVLPEIAGNPDQLKQVFLQLLNNAVEAITGMDGATRTDSEGRTHVPEHKVLIDASFDDTKLHILFSDTGPGFRDPHRVFDPFFTTKQPGEGTGLGLSICYGIVREHQGEINAFNLHPFGAAVVVDLPLRNSSLQNEPFRAAERKSGSSAMHQAQRSEYPAIPELP